MVELYKPNELDVCPFKEKCAINGHFIGGTWCTTPPFRKCDMWKIYVREIKQKEDL